MMGFPFAGEMNINFMAKKSWMERNKKKQETVKKFAALRAELKAKRDYVGLAKLPRNASPTRVVNRCSMSAAAAAVICASSAVRV